MRLDEMYDMWNSQKLRERISKRPSDYWRSNCAITATFISRGEAEMRHEIGVETIMWGTDFPHPEGSWPHTHSELREVFTGLPEQEIVEMLGGNAARFYGFDADALAPLVARIGPRRSDFEGAAPELVGTRAS